MNRTKIEWTDYTWNPVTGCERLCDFDKDGRPDCYAYKNYLRFHRSFEPTYHPERLEEIKHLKPPTKARYESRKPWIRDLFPDRWLIFPCSVSDLFASWTSPDWRLAVLRAIDECPRNHIFQLLTHSPERFGTVPAYTNFSSRTWVGISVHSQADVEKIGYLRDIRAGVRFISVEPMLGPLDPTRYMDAIDWIIIGRLTKANRWIIEPSWIHDLLKVAGAYHVPVFIKDNVGLRAPIREFPVGYIRASL